MEKFKHIDILDIVNIEEYEELVDIQIDEDETFIIDGGIISHNSAIKGMVGARNPKIHAGLGLKGKVENIHGQKTKEILESKVLTEIMGAIGLVPGERINRHLLRYGKIYIATDADEDGKNIFALLVNFFYLNWPELFDKDKEPIIFNFNTPFIIAKKGKERKYWYANDYQNFKPEDWKGWDITRAKGLATLEKPDWSHCLSSPNLYPLLDDGNMNEILDLIFNGSKADLRKQWMGI